jgi:phosphate transport system substrate-binding protein
MNFIRFFFLFLFINFQTGWPFDAPYLKINGSTTVNPIVADAAEHFRAMNWRITADTQGGSSGGISMLAEHLVDIGMSSKEIKDEDKRKFPTAHFISHVIGYDGVALVVSKSVYESGVHFLTRQQIQDLYEGKTRNWKELEGAESPVVFFDKEPGRGTWEVFADFVYGSSRLAPKVFHPQVGANEEARSKVAAHKSGITQLSFAWADEASGVKALAIKDDKGDPIAPSLETIKNGRYSMKRPLLLLTDGAATGAAKTFIDYILSDAGQLLVKKHGYIALSAQ